MDTKQYAEQLVEFFLENGNFVGSNKMPLSNAGDAAQGDTGTLLYQGADTLGFGGLQVESVGYEVKQDGTTGEEINVHVRGRGKRRRKESEDGKIINIIPANSLYAIDLKGFSRKPTRGDVYKHNGRIACGSSCAPAGEEHSGTLGALVRRNDDPNRLFILSNNHVIASCNQTPIATHIMSPSNADYRPSGTPPVAIGQLSSIVELRSAHYSHVPPAFFDAALAEARPELLSSWQGDDISGYDTPSEIIRPFTGMAVKKFGRTTKLTNGIVTDKIALAKPIEYRHKTFSAICWFTDIWAVEPEKPGDAFSLPGDSGSLVVTSGNPSSVGIVFAGAKGLSYMIPLKELSEAMGFQLVSAHGC